MAEPTVFTVAIERGSAGAVVRLFGELDISGDVELRRALRSLIREHRPVALDLSGLRFCDVPGVRALVEFATEAADSGTPFEVRGATANVSRVIDLTRSRRVLRLVA